MIKRKASKSQKLLLIIVLLILSLLIAVVILSKNTSEKMLQKVSEVEEIDFTKIYNEYKENQPNANDKYMHEDFILNVMVTGIKESNGKVYVITEKNGYSCDIYFFKDQKEKINKLKVGDKIKCIARVDEIGGFFAVVIFKDGVIL